MSGQPKKNAPKLAGRRGAKNTILADYVPEALRQRKAWLLWKSEQHPADLLERIHELALGSRP